MSSKIESIDSEFDWSVRAYVYRVLGNRGFPPSCHETSIDLSRDLSDVERAYQRLNDAHAFFLQPGTLHIRMAHPFSGIETDYRVRANGVDYWANCAWDMLGIPAALHADAEISAPETDTGGRIEMVVLNDRASGWDGLIHFSVPFRHWYDDLVHT